VAVLSPQDANEMPALREGHSAKRVDKGEICQHGIIRADCHHFACGGPDECYDCGYADGLSDGRDLMEREMEDRYEGMD